MNTPEKLATRGRRSPSRGSGDTVTPPLEAERSQEPLVAFSGWQVRSDDPGSVRRYEFPTVRDGGAFAAFAASLLAELDAVSEGEIAGSTAAVRGRSGRAVGEVTAIDRERVAGLEGRSKEPR
jgi:hypothetical protein